MIPNIEKQLIILPNDTISVSYEDFPTLNKDVEHIFIPNGCVWCSEYAFRNLPNLKKMWLPQSLTLVNETALSGLDNLEYILVHNMETYYTGHQRFDYPDNFDGLFATYGAARFFNQFHRNYRRKLNIISVRKENYNE